MNFFRCAAEQPIGIGQIWETARTFGIRAVTLDTISIKQVFTYFLCCRIFGNLLDRHFGIFVVKRFVALFGLCHFFAVLLDTGPFFTAESDTTKIA